MKGTQNPSRRRGLLRRSLCCLLAGGMLWALAWVLWPEAAAPAFARMTAQVLVLDPGHGGEDGGAVSVTGTPESRINLAVAGTMDRLMGFYGAPVVMTRYEDVSLHDGDAATLREKKVSDLHNRADLINGLKNAALLSVHQNASPNPSHQGVQVFYGPEPGSRPLAQALQQALTAVLVPEKERAAQAVSDSVYLMNHVTCRAVLVECGFVSNPQEALLLEERAYQMKLAMTMTACWLTAGNTQEGETFV